MSLNNEMLMELVRFLNREASQSDLEQLSLLIESLRGLSPSERSLYDSQNVKEM